MKIEIIVETLKKCELFNHLTEDELHAIANMGKIEEYNAGDEIFQQGNVGNKLYILSEGHISLYRKMQLANGRKGSTPVYEAREKPYRRLLGGWSAIIGARHVQMCTARCQSPPKVISLPIEDLKTFLVRILRFTKKYWRNWYFYSKIDWKAPMQPWRHFNIMDGKCLRFFIS